MPPSIRLPDDVEKRLSKPAERTGRSKAFYLRTMIEEGLDKIEYEYQILQDASDYRAGKLETRSADEMRRRYDLEG